MRPGPRARQLLPSLLALLLPPRLRGDYVKTVNYILGDALPPSEASVYSYVLTMQGCLTYYPACFVNGSATTTTGAAGASDVLLTTPNAPTLLCDATPALASTPAAGAAPPLPWPNPPYAPPPGWPFAPSTTAPSAAFWLATNQSIACTSPTSFTQYSSATPPSACGMASAPPAGASGAVSRSLGAGAAFTAHTPGIALLTSSQCVPGDAAAALAALKGPRTKHFFYTIYTHAVGALPAGSKCDAATARNATTEVFPRAYTCVPLATAINDDNTQTSEQDSTLPNRGGSYAVDCTAARVLRSTTYATPDCSGAPVSTLAFPADDQTCTPLSRALDAFLGVLDERANLPPLRAAAPPPPAAALAAAAQELSPSSSTSA